MRNDLSITNTRNSCGLPISRTSTSSAHITCSVKAKYKMQITRLVLRQITRGHRMYSVAAPAASTLAADKLVPPAPEGVAKPLNPKLDSIVNNIAALNLLEVAELSSLLKQKLNLPDTAFMPQVAVGAGAGRAAAAEDEEEAAPKKVQTSFKVKLVKFDEKQKVALIKEVKNLLEGMNLVQAKKFVESAPTIVKQDIPKEEAEKLKEALSKAGAIIEIE